ncbi:hypothetical protein LTR78_010759 [Recurvomyces mirabilis]|uniref:Uncharacterized protein n=1 Tax=Recurvomyces mirabilis TaxID=574656 RepID=A0AAE0TRI9_9PEZI|nr:hypothetical protein LTR78_010759 [Recurvomyces mirabilis]
MGRWDECDEFGGLGTECVSEGRGWGGGPYIPTPPTTDPWICPVEQGGAIDPAYFHDASSGKDYILYKIDGNSIQGPTPILLQQISPDDGVSKIGEPVQILTNDAGENLVEAPGMFRTKDERFVLAYSTGAYTDGSYALRYAIASSLTGAFVKANRETVARDG